MINSKDFSEKKIYQQVNEESEQGIILSTIAFGKTTAAINFMREMAFQGKGSFLQILSESEAQSSLVEEIKRQSARGR
jgi:general stress protein 26